MGRSKYSETFDSAMPLPRSLCLQESRCKTFSPNSLLLGVLNSFLRCVRPLCHCLCPPFPAGHVAFLFICLPGLSLLVSALFRWPSSISIRLSPRSVTAGVRPFPLAMWCPPFSAGHAAFNSFVFKMLSLLLSPRIGACTAGVRPFPLAM